MILYANYLGVVQIESICDPMHRLSRRCPDLERLRSHMQTEWTLVQDESVPAYICRLNGRWSKMRACQFIYTNRTDVGLG